MRYISENKKGIYRRPCALVSSAATVTHGFSPSQNRQGPRIIAAEVNTNKISPIKHPNYHRVMVPDSCKVIARNICSSTPVDQLTHPRERAAPLSGSLLRELSSLYANIRGVMPPNTVATNNLEKDASTQAKGIDPPSRPSP